MQWICLSVTYHSNKRYGLDMAIWEKVQFLHTKLHQTAYFLFVYAGVDMDFPVLAPPISEAMPHVSNAANDSELN